MTHTHCCISTEEREIPVSVVIKIGPTKTFHTDLTNHSTVHDLKARIEEKEGFLIDVQRLKLNGRMLDDDDKTLDDYGT